MSSTKKRDAKKRKRQDETEQPQPLELDLSGISPNGQWYTIPNLISQVLYFLPVTDVIKSKTVCKNWYKVQTTHEFSRKYIANFLDLKSQDLTDLDQMLNVFKTSDDHEKKMISSYEGMLNSLLRLKDQHSVGGTYSEMIRSLLNEYDQSPNDNKILTNILKLTQKEMKAEEEEQQDIVLKPPTVEMDGKRFSCQNYRSIHSVLLSQERNCVEHHGLDIEAVESTYFVVLNNGYPMTIHFESESGRYDGKLKIQINEIPCVDLRWGESDFDEDHNWKFIQLLRKAFDFKSADTPITSDQQFLTIFYSWLMALFYSTSGGVACEIPDRCFGGSILAHHYFDDEEEAEEETAFNNDAGDGSDPFYFLRD